MRSAFFLLVLAVDKRLLKEGSVMPAPPSGRLPAHPDLQHLKKQAKDLSRAHADGNADACAPLRHLPRLASVTDADILAADVTLHDAQNAVARQYGYGNWSLLRDAVAGNSPTTADTQRHAPSFGSLSPKLREHIEHLGFHSVGAYRIWCHKQGLGASLEKSGEQLYAELLLQQKAPEKPPLRRNYCPAEARKITQAYRGETDGLWSGWLKPFEGVSDEGERDALHRLLLHCARYAAIGGPPVWQVARHYRDWRHPVEEWIPKGRSFKGYLMDLTRFLLGRDELPGLEQERVVVESPSACFAQVAAQRDTVLSEAAVAQYEQRGWVQVPQAFAPDVAAKIVDFMWAKLEARHGFRRDDPSSWRIEGWDPDRQPHHWTMLRLNRSKDDPVFAEIGTPRLRAALAEIAGEHAASLRQSWGAFTPVFPSRDEAPWRPGTRWGCYPAVEARWRTRIHTLFSPVQSRGGACLVVEGSHRLMRRYIDELSTSDRLMKLKLLTERFVRKHAYFSELLGRDADRGDRVRRYMEETTVVDDVPLRVVELTGDPGDAFLCEHAIVSTRSRNMTNMPVFTRG
jgi:hypothetical protein